MRRQGLECWKEVSQALATRKERIGWRHRLAGPLHLSFSLGANIVSSSCHGVMKRRYIPYDRIVSPINNNRTAACAIVLGTVVIALSVFTGAGRNVVGYMTTKRPEAARMGLSQMSLEYTPEIFVRSARKGDMTAVNLFLAAGMDSNATDK